MFCVKCGNKLTATARFCKKCGNPVRNRMAPSPPGGAGPPPPSRRQLPNAIKIAGIAVIAAVLVSAFGLIFWFGATDEAGAEIPEIPGSEMFHAVYRSHVVVVSQAQYSFTYANGIVTITIYAPCDGARSISVGDTFVLEPTIWNIEGLAGTVIGIAEQAGSLVISARLPESLDEIFYEFEFVAEFDILAHAGESVLADELIGLEGVELIGNPTSYRGIRLNRNIFGIDFEGEIRLYDPRLQVAIRTAWLGAPVGVDHLVLITRVALDIDVTASGNIERIIPLFTIPIRKLGTGIDVPVGIRVSASGEFALYIDAGVNAEFGIRNNNFVAQVTPWYSIDFQFNARASVSANVQARARILWGNVYGIQGDFGKGVQTNSAMQARCPQNICFIVETFHVRRIASLTDWGVLRNVQALRFNANLAQNVPSVFWYHSNMVRRRNCPHVGGQAALPGPGAPAPADAPIAEAISPSTQVSVGNIIQFGGFDWRVLEVQGNQALVVTDRIIGHRDFHHVLEDVTWETSEIRQWLNYEFFNSFSPENQELIMQTYVVNNNNPWYGTNGGNNTTDRVFLLSVEEVVRYFGDSGKLNNRPYGARQLWDEYSDARSVLEADGSGFANWWLLRTPGMWSRESVGIDYFGTIFMDGRSVSSYFPVASGIRPALWLRLDS